MIISVSKLEDRLFEIVREIEREGIVIDIERLGRVVARVIPVTARSVTVRPWEALHGSGTLLSDPEESMLEEAVPTAVTVRTCYDSRDER